MEQRDEIAWEQTASHVWHCSECGNGCSPTAPGILEAHARCHAALFMWVRGVRRVVDYPNGYEPGEPVFGNGTHHACEFNRDRPNVDRVAWCDKMILCACGEHRFCGDPNRDHPGMHHIEHAAFDSLRAHSSRSEPTWLHGIERMPSRPIRISEPLAWLDTDLLCEDA